MAGFLLLPLLTTLVYSFANRWLTILPEGFTLQNYVLTLTNQKFMMGILRGMIISVIPVLITNVSVLLALFVVIVYLPQMERWYRFCV
ncbi:MAG: hypothetical protein LUE16_03680 [Lachnospiraceae bacterium]|nr:hypothetical protein [Lachnospiraceae bacterium]